ncbi:MAG TPA: ATP-binding protein [Cytophagales bacterium]|nr:ATP-binding protein [Cytophagales bacterium]
MSISNNFNIYDSLATMASFYFKVPISIIVLSKDKTQTILSEIGIENFKVEYLLDNDPNDKDIFEIPDIKSQPFFNNSFLKDHNILYYLEAPLIVSDERVGSLCFMDIITRKLDESQKEAVKMLTNQITEVIKIKLHSQELDEEASILSQFLTGSSETLAILNSKSFLFERASKELISLLSIDSDISKLSFLDLLDSGEQIKIKNLLSSVEEEMLYEFETKIYRPNIKEKYFKWKLKLKGDRIYLHGRNVTEKRKIKKQLLENEERYKRLSEFVFESIAIHKNGVLLDFNPNFLKTFGYENEEAIGMNLFHFLPRIYRKIVNNETSSQTIETLGVRKDSSTFPAEVISKTMETDGQTVSILSIRDNTERKKLEKELLKTTVFQKAVLDSSSFAIISTDFTGQIKTFNKGAERMLGILKEEVVDKSNIITLYLQEEIKEKAEALSAELKTPVEPGFSVFVEKLSIQNVDENEWTFIHKDKTKLIISITATTLKDKLGEITGYLFMGTDISDKKKAEREIIEKSQILNGIVTNMPVFVFKLDNEGIFTQSIGTGLNNLNLIDNELVGTNIFTTFENEALLIKKAYEGEYISFINRKEVGGKDLYYEYFIFPDIAHKGGLIGFALDITERIMSEQKLQESAAHLIKTNKELDQFAYVVSHDLKAPLRAIANLSEWIEEDLGKEIKEDVKHNMEILRGRVFRMQNLIDGILSYSRVGRAKTNVEEVNINELVREVINVVGVPSSFTVNILKELPTVVTNSIWLEQIFSNLISNAVKYHDKPNGTLTIDVNVSNDCFEFSVADDGPGIAPEYYEKVFVIFQTLNARDTKESTGVGLAIVKKIVEEQGGKIWIESNNGKGVKFIFTLPRKIHVEN